MGTSADVDVGVRVPPKDPLGPPQEIRQKAARKSKEMAASLDMELLSEWHRSINVY
jgi:hypothetical protein